VVRRRKVSGALKALTEKKIMREGNETRGGGEKEEKRHTEGGGKCEATQKRKEMVRSSNFLSFFVINIFRWPK
jgi:hypothetical protein